MGNKGSGKSATAHVADSAGDTANVERFSFPGALPSAQVTVNTELTETAVMSSL